MDDYYEYMLWSECNACTYCDGVGEDCDDGETWVCPHCEGAGIEPGAEDYAGDPPI